MIIVSMSFKCKALIQLTDPENFQEGPEITSSINKHLIYNELSSDIFSFNMVFFAP